MVFVDVIEIEEVSIASIVILFGQALIVLSLAGIAQEMEHAGMDLQEMVSAIASRDSREEIARWITALPNPLLEHGELWE
jgi:hypothetical protein